MRYGDNAPPTDFSFHRSMQYDMEMLKFVEELKAEEFAGYIQKEKDQRRISGFSPIYSLLRLIQAEKGQVLRYDRGMTDQYNSTVTYASMGNDPRSRSLDLDDGEKYASSAAAPPAAFSHRSGPRVFLTPIPSL